MSRRSRKTPRPRGPRVVIAIAVVVVAAAAAIALSGGEDDATAPSAPMARAAPGPRAQAASRRAARIVSGLSTERKVAQLFAFGLDGPGSPVLGTLRRRDLGGVVLEAGAADSPEAARRMTRAVRTAADGQLAPWVFAEQEGAESNALAFAGPATAASELGDPAAGAAEAKAAARELRNLGVNAVLGPVLDVGGPSAPGVGPLAFADDPDLVSAFARRVASAWRRGGVLAAPEHFPGLGAATQSTDAGPATVGLSDAELAERDLAPFVAAFDAGAPAVVIGHGLYSGGDAVTPASLSSEIATDLLRTRLGFRGVAITDDLAAPAVTAAVSVPDAAAQAIFAGADIVYVSGPRADQRASFDSVLTAARDGRITPQRLDEAAGRVVDAKLRYGLAG